MFSFLRKSFAATRVELEADLQAVAGAAGRGEFDYEMLGTDARKVEFELRGVADGDAEILINGASWRSVRISGGACDIGFDTARGDQIPELRPADRIDVRQSGAIALSGRLRRD